MQICVLFPTGAEGVAFCGVSEKVMDSAKQVVVAESCNRRRSAKEGVWFSTSEEPQMVVGTDICNHGCAVGIGLSFTQPGLKLHAHVFGEEPLIGDFMPKRHVRSPRDASARSKR